MLFEPSPTRSKSDSVVVLDAKMRERWIANGVRLAWLVLPYLLADGRQAQVEEVHVYREDSSHQTYHGLDQEIKGEDVLSGFVFDLRILKR